VPTAELLEAAVQLQVMHTAVVASLVCDLNLIRQVNRIAESVENLARLGPASKPQKRNELMM
jgi:hypothetical protein